MRRVWLVGGVLVCYLLQVSFFGAARLFGVVPNVLLVLLVVLVPVLAPVELLVVAAGAGLLLDLASGVDFGLRTAFFVVAALGLLVLRTSGIDSERATNAAWLILVAGTLYNAVIAAGLASAASLPSLWSLVSLSLREYLLNLASFGALRYWALLLRRESGLAIIRRRTV